MAAEPTSGKIMVAKLGGAGKDGPRGRNFEI